MNYRRSVKIPPFLNKLYEILGKQEYSNVITWNPEGDAFIIVDLSQFCETILPKYFKHSNFASFVRQLNMYDFHKTKQGNSDQAFKHQNFRRDDFNHLGSIKRKNNNECLKKEEKVKNKKFDFETIKKEAMNICNTLDDLKNRVECLEGKHSFLEICHSQLVARNHKIKLQLGNLIEKEKNLENLLLFALKNFAPNLFFKNNELKYWEGILPELGQDHQTNSSSNFIVEKSAFQKNDVLGKIFKELKNLINCYKLIDNPDHCNDNPEIVSSVKINPLKSDKKVESVNDQNNFNNQLNTSTINPAEYVSNNAVNINDINDSVYYNHFFEWQKRIYDNFEESSRIVSDKEDLIPKNRNYSKLINSQMIKKHCQDDAKFEDINNQKQSFIEVVTPQKFEEKFEDSNKNNISNSLMLMNKRHRNKGNEEILDQRHFNSGYKIEKK